MIRIPRRRALGGVVAAWLAAASCGDEPAGPTADGSPPRVQITSPREGASFTDAVACSIEASDDRGIARLELRIYGVDSAGDVQADSVVADSGPLTAPPYSFLWSTANAANGRYALIAAAADAAGNTAADTVRIELRGDRWPPVVTIRSPLDETIVKGIVPVIVEAADDSPIDSVWIVIRSGDDDVLMDAGLAAAPFQLAWDTRWLPQGAYRVCASARDREGNQASSTCSRVRAYPRAALQYDDGSAEAGRGDPNYTWQMAAVFQNPYDVAVVVDTLWIFIHGSSPLGAPFRFVLWDVEDGHPTSEREGTRQLAVRNPRGAFGYYHGWSTIVPAGGLIAAGWQQTATEATVLGMDRTSPYHDDTFFFSFPAGAPSWVTFELLGYAEIPMIRLHVSAFTGRLPLPTASDLRTVPMAYGIVEPGAGAADSGGWLSPLEGGSD